jgi:signal peptidase
MICKIKHLFSSSSIPPSNPEKRKTIFIVLLIVTILTTILTIYFANIYYNINDINGISYSAYLVGSGSMEPTFQIGDLLIVKKVNNLSTAQFNEFNNLQVGDPILFINPTFFNQKGQLLNVVHRVIEIYKDSKGEKIVKTKGDANPVSIPKLDYPLFQKFYIGKVMYIIPKAGFIIKSISPPINYVIIIATIIAIIIVRFKKREQ